MSQFPSQQHDIAASGTPGKPARLIDVVLDGGPRELSESSRTGRVPYGEEKIKVPFYGGYEHFERTADGVGSADEPVIFRWTMRTRVAE